MKKYYKIFMLLFSVLMVGSLIMACSSIDKKSNINQTDTSVINNDNTDKELPALYGGEYVGYIQSMDLNTKTLLFDDAEIITSEDTKRIEELELSDEDMYTGFIIYNEREVSEEFIFDETVIINLFDTGDLNKMNTYSLEDFISLVESRPIFCKITIVEGKVYNIVEEYLP